MNSSVLSARFYLVLFLLVAGARVSNAAVESGVNRIAGSAMINSATASCSDNKYNYIVTTPTWTNLFTDERGVGRITLGFDQNSLVYINTGYTAKVTVQIKYYTDAAPTTPVSFGTQVLTVDYDPLVFGLVNQTDRHVFELNSTNSSGNIIRVDATILSIVDFSNIPMAAPANLFLEAATEVERYYDLDLATVPSSSILTLGSISAANELPLNWGYITGAEEYDVEWTYVNDYDATGTQLGSTPANALVLDFAHNSTRITTPNNHFEIPLLFDAGYLAVRIRPVGYAYDASSSSWKKVAGRWTSDNTTSTTTLGAFNTATGSAHVEHILISGAHRLEMNWQYNASFAEEGKKKEVVSYYDGSLRNRQTVTKTSTDKKVLVGETVYDFNGRGAVSILPSPVAGTNLPIDYQLSFNRNASSVAYSRWDFDEDASSCVITTSAMSTAYGTSNYYSSSNPEQADAQQFLPDAGGYPFAQVEYTPDNTGRVRRQGGVGTTFQLNSGHETFYYYAQPFQEELDRLFGSEAGYKKHYNKTITFDGNGQASVTYVDQEGRTIATALAGDTLSTPLLALREGGDGTTSYSYNQLTLTVDLLGKDHPADVDDDQDDNLLSFNGEELTLSTQLPVTASGTYSFEYTLVGDKFDYACLPAGVCYTCVFDIEIDILDQCGNRPAVLGPLLPYPALPVSQTVGTMSTDCADPSVNFSLSPSPLQVSLNPGVYTVVKRLKINQAAMAAYLADYLAQDSCVTTLQAMIDTAVAHVDTSGCNAACPECEDEYKSPCDASYQMMLSDVSPYGQYCEHKDSYGNVNPGAFPLSVLNTGNVLPKFEADWKHPYHEINGNYDYYEPDGSTISYIPLTGTSPNYSPAVDNIANVVMVGTTAYIKPKNLLNVDDFVANWTGSWALSLVKYHPEYCYYEWCKGNGVRQTSMTVSSDNYDSLLLITSTRAAAVTAGLLDPLDDAVTGASNQSGCNDPYFQTSGLGSSDYASMHARILDYDANFPGNSIWKLAKIMTTCGNYFNSTQVAIDACLGTIYTDQTQYITGDQEWLNFKMLYFSLKQQYQQDRNDAAAMACDGYNGCIGNQQFNPMAAGMVSNPFSGSEFLDDANSSPSSTNTNARQPCCDLTYWLYAGKVKRFVNTDDANALSSSASVTSYNQYAISGQCPDALAFQTFLNKLATTDQLTASGLSLLTMNEFIPALYNSMVPAMTSTTVSYTGTAGTTTLSLAFSGASVSCTSPTLIFGPTSSFSWANYLISFEIDGFSNLLTDNSGGFTVTVAIDDDMSSLTPPVYEVMTGNAGCFILTCPPPTVCTPNATALDAVTLLNLLANTAAPHLVSTTGVNLSNVSSPYSTFFNSSALNDYFSCGSDYFWKSLTSLTEYGILCNNTTSTRFLNVVFSPSLPAGTITSFSNPVLLSANQVQLTVNTTTTPTIVVMKIALDSVRTNLDTIALGDCADPVPLQCQGPDFQRRADLEGLLTAKINALTSTGVALNPAPAFTPLLRPYGNGTYTWDAITSPSNNQWITISDGTQLCTLKLAFAAAPTGGHTFSNILSFGQLVADETTMVNGQAFNFTITAFYSSGSELINGTSCYAIRNCPVCAISSTSTYENFDLAAASAGTGLTLSTSCPIATAHYSLTHNESVRCSDATLTGGDRNNPATGNYMFANVASSTTATLWSKTITPAAYTPYTFTAWFMDATVADNSPTSLATMELWVDGVQVKTAIVIESPGVWQSITAQWNGANSATPFTIAVKVTTNSISSWQIALDDISFYTPGCDPISNPPLSPTYPYVNPCASNLINIATLNATQQYEQYIQAISAQFTADYIKHCMSTAVETFDLTFAETEYQYTLYYYDQAGNLVRTVPPQGVVTTDLTAIDIVTGLPIGQNIKDDRTARLTNPAAAKTFYTNHGFATNYKYNSLNQLTKQITPDGGTTRFWYDRLGRIIASQNAKQEANPTTKAWSYTVYDALGRISEVGELYTNTDLVGMSSVTLYALLNDPTYPDNWAGAASANTRNDVTKTYYDAEQGSFGVATYFSSGAQENLRKRVATAAVYDTYNGTITDYTSASHYTYDIHGNVSELIQEIPQLGHLDDVASGNYQRYKQVRYEYDLVSGNVNKVMYQHEQADRFYHKYEYDADNRVTAAYTSYDDRTWDRDAKYFYYKHGPLSRTETGDAKVQGMDYAYTLQGWIKGVNSNSLDVAHDMGQDGNSSVNAYSSPDEMGYSLSYFDGDYAGITSNPAIAAIASSGLDAASPNLYNGNIRHMVTSIRYFGSPQAMAYQYDQLNRIRSSEQYTNFNSGTNSWNSGGSGNADYREVFTYDHNGNIIRQVRNDNTLTGAMDDLHYYYHTQASTPLVPVTYDPQSGTPTDATNKLAYVTDAVSTPLLTTDIENQSSGNYAYDEIGQLKSDAQEEIATIAWTVYGKIRSVTRSGSSTKADLEFQYDAMGNRMLKISKPRTGGSPSTQEEWTYTYYVRDASGNVMATYERIFTAPTSAYDDVLKLKEQNLYGSSRIGLRSPDLQLVSKNYTFSSYSGQLLVGTPNTQTTTAASETSFLHVIGQKAYELSNHLGNVLVTVADARMPVAGSGPLSSTVVSYSALVVSATDYSAFGAPMPGRQFSSGNYRYGFNGKEKQDELHGNSGDAYDFDVRIYDARLGMFLSVDPHAIQYTSWSPYQFAHDNPIKHTDDGYGPPGSLAGVGSLKTKPGTTPPAASQGFATATKANIAKPAPIPTGAGITVDGTPPPSVTVTAFTSNQYNGPTGPTASSNSGTGTTSTTASTTPDITSTTTTSSYPVTVLELNETGQQFGDKLKIDYSFSQLQGKQGEINLNSTVVDGKSQGFDVSVNKGPLRTTYNPVTQSVNTSVGLPAPGEGTFRTGFGMNSDMSFTLSSTYRNQYGTGPTSNITFRPGGGTMAAVVLTVLCCVEPPLIIPVAAGCSRLIPTLVK